LVRDLIKSVLNITSNKREHDKGIHVKCIRRTLLPFHIKGPDSGIIDLHAFYKTDLL